MSDGDAALLEICCYCCVLLCVCCKEEKERSDRRTREQKLINEVAQLRADLAERPNVIIAQPMTRQVMNCQPPSYDDSVMETPSAPLWSDK